LITAEVALATSVGDAKDGSPPCAPAACHDCTHGFNVCTFSGIDLLVVYEFWKMFMILSIDMFTKTYYIYTTMDEQHVVWDEAKNLDNKLKHKVSFEVAQYVFSDPLRIWRLDRSKHNTSGETRWQTIGKVGKLFFVVYTEHEKGLSNTKRIISAREAEKHERRSYNGYHKFDSNDWTKDT